MKRSVTVFVCAAVFALSLAVIKAVAVAGITTLPPARVMTFAASVFGLVAVLLDWALLRNAPPSDAAPVHLGAAARPLPSLATVPPAMPYTDPIIVRARRRPIVFCEICPPPSAGLSFYGGAPVGPPGLIWPCKPDGVPLSFLMQWDCIELADQDVTGLLPRDGVLYLFADLEWNDFQFGYSPGPSLGWQPLTVPPELPPVSGGAYHVPYCSALIAPEHQEVPRLLPKWPFTPAALDLPTGEEALFWHEGDDVGEALLKLQHPEGVPPAMPLRQRLSSFGRPFPAFPHDYASIRVVAARVLAQLQFPAKRFLNQTSEQEREAAAQRWRGEATQRYLAAATHEPAAAVAQSVADETWEWIRTLEPVLTPGWDRLVEECVNVSLGLGTKAALPPELIAVCAESHRLASAYLHEEYPDRRTPEALAAWEQRKLEGRLQEVRTVHAPCPNHMFGPPSYVQGYVEEHLEDMVLLLELSTRSQIGHEFGEGVLQFMIRPGDLGARRFDKVRLIASAY